MIKCWLVVVEKYVVVSWLYVVDVEVVGLLDRLHVVGLEMSNLIVPLLLVRSIARR